MKLEMVKVLDGYIWKVSTYIAGNWRMIYMSTDLSKAVQYAEEYYEKFLKFQ